ncbi:MAG: Fur family transcriptional regulator [Acidobacteria bacterium]|nr:Fur family transcriptional regulator [Acidobacteriota bacterium]MCZ6746876.1 Fur family transcriptional regulator [Acidobacteriota bacterium]MCZ6833413.1 Fur family transcriptional regulator [Acidobacteriota bacterium]
MKVPPAGEEEAQFRALLRHEGLRMTPERSVILSEIFKIEGHFQPDDLLVRFRTNGVRISRATIYRTLDLLVSCGLVRRETFAGDAHYERAHHVEGHAHHDHLVCTSCGAIFEFYNSEIERLQEVVCREFDFELQGHSHQISGLCADCRRRAAVV